MTCCECGEEIVTIKGAGFEVTAWEIYGDLMWKKKTGKMMCPKCTSERRYGAPDPNQMTIPA